MNPEIFHNKDRTILVLFTDPSANWFEQINPDIAVRFNHAERLTIEKFMAKPGRASIGVVDGRSSPIPFFFISFAGCKDPKEDGTLLVLAVGGGMALDAAEIMVANLAAPAEFSKSAYGGFHLKSVEEKQQLVKRARQVITESLRTNGIGTV